MTKLRVSISGWRQFWDQALEWREPNLGLPHFFSPPIKLQESCVKGSEKNIFLQSQDVVAKETIEGISNLLSSSLYCCDR